MVVIVVLKCRYTECDNDTKMFSDRIFYNDQRMLVTLNESAQHR